MSRYFFDVQDSASGADDEGIVFPNMQAAFAAGMRFAGELLKDVAPARLWEEGDWTVSVRDENGLQLFSFVVISVLAPGGRDLLARQTNGSALAVSFPAAAARS